MKENGTVVTELPEITMEFSEFYSAVYQEQNNCAGINWDQELADFPLRVPDALNARLREPYTQDEVYRALIQMHPAKALDVTVSPPFSTKILGHYQGRCE